MTRLLKPFTPLSLSRNDALRALACLLGWLVLQYEGPRLLGYHGSAAAEWGPIAALLLAALLAMAAAAIATLGRPPAP